MTKIRDTKTPGLRVFGFFITREQHVNKLETACSVLANTLHEAGNLTENVKANFSWLENDILDMTPNDEHPKVMDIGRTFAAIGNLKLANETIQRARKWLEEYRVKP